MSISFNTVRTNLFNWTTANVPVGMPVIYYYQNAPRGQADYVTLYISMVTQIGRDWTQEPLSDTGISNMVGDREFTFRIQAYGNDPLTVLENLRTSLQNATVLASLRAVGLVYVDWYPINDLTELVDTRYENRGSWDSRWRLAQTYTETIGNIDTAVITGTIKDQTGHVVLNETITIP